MPSGALCVWMGITRRPRVSRRRLLEECEGDCAQKGSKGVKMAQNRVKIGSKWLKMAQNRFKMARSGVKMDQNRSKLAQNGSN